ncbi:MFS transporter [Pseudomonas tohonis]|uniref:MFS transporter n=1 Tax=Pseudomonas tohonis TaxID=2725477 RepID=A0A6J4E6Q1_9PSED|nr:MFS transporter [Pseudomonas tohonis]BCG25310.1 MFS transporter [Pseudomonas tohonis]GJN54860.1 MFS transporter [Pseudomonas tohonis]
MTREDTAFRPGPAWTIAFLLAFMMLVNFLDKVVIGLVAVPMTEELGLSPTEFGLIGGALHWLFAASAVVGGFLANRRPTRTLLLGMGLFWALIQLPMLLASSLWMIVACRVLLGIGEGPASPVATHALYKWFPDDRRSLPVALLHSGSAMGLLVAGAMIPWVSLHYGWRTNFAVLAVIGLVWCGLWLLLGREGTIDSLRRGQLATPDAHRLPYRRLLGDPSVLGNYLCHFAANWSLALTLTWVPSYLQVGLGMDPLRTGHMFVLFVVVTTPLSLFMAWVSQRLLRRGLPSRLARGAFVSLCLIAGGLFSASLMLELPVAVRIVNLTLSGGLALVMYSVGPAMLAEFTPASQRGGILAIGNAVASLAGLSAPVVTGLLVSGAGAAHPQGYAQGFLVCGAVLVVAGLVGLVTMNPQRSQERLAQDETSAACSRA